MWKSKVELNVRLTAIFHGIVFVLIDDVTSSSYDEIKQLSRLTSPRGILATSVFIDLWYEWPRGPIITP